MPTKQLRQSIGASKGDAPPIADPKEHMSAMTTGPENPMSHFADTPTRTNDNSGKRRAAGLAVLLGGIRVALGLGYMCAPKELGQVTFGADAYNNTPELRFTNRMLGSRELYLGAAIVVASRARSRTVTRILLGAAAADAWDAFAVMSTKGTPTHAKLSVGMVALTASIVELFVAQLFSKKHADRPGNRDS
ncbi:hypothetical protein [Mycobacteroides chelonae]|uniref:hypothetical protein n=1 Tax=Mycobacteroides chelonae TaxID=1774 RepID=UPI0010427A66|nr:hypothetical protein [Mycobacteroides chelonae]